MNQSFAEIASTIKTSRWINREFGNSLVSECEMSGEELYAKLAERGLVDDWRELSEISIGSTLYIGLSGYERLG